jgi:hypothetical protein
VDENKEVVSCRAHQFVIRAATELAADFKKPSKKDLFMSVSLECGLFTGTVADRFDDATVIVREIRGRQLDPARHRAELWQNGPLPRYSCRKRKPTKKLTKLLG